MIARLLLPAAFLALAACGGSNPDRLPDDLAGAEGTPIADGYNADAVAPEPEVPPPPADNPLGNVLTEVVDNETVEEPAEEVAAVEPSTAGFAPSFPCAGNLGRIEQMICGDRELAALDRALTRTYARALGDAGPSRGELLRSTAGDFLDYRNNCPVPACVAQAYRGRLREIEDIMALPR